MATPLTRNRPPTLVIFAPKDPTPETSSLPIDYIEASNIPVPRSICRIAGNLFLGNYNDNRRATQEDNPEKVDIVYVGCLQFSLMSSNSSFRAFNSWYISSFLFIIIFVFLSNLYEQRFRSCNIH